MISLIQQEKSDLLRQLQREILPLQGLKSVAGKATVSLGLEPMEPSFPNGRFPTGVIHEFTTTGPESSAATGGFLTGIMSGLMKQTGAAVWISSRRTVFPPSLHSFGVKPHHVIFIDLPNEKKVLWAMEEALKCPGISAVVGEVSDISFTDSRRLQLATEQSGVTGLMMRHPGRKLSANACAARWRVDSLPSETEAGMPGVGFPMWKVDLLKIRNGRPGSWAIGWSGDGFHFHPPQVVEIPGIGQRKAG